MVSADAVLGVVIVNYRRADLLQRALLALQHSDRQPDQTVVVDVSPIGLDASPIAPPALDVAAAPRLITMDGNPGYAAACNRGAGDIRADWFLFMNADVFVSPTCIGGVLAEAARDPAVGIATCRLLKEDGRMDHACHRGSPSVIDSLAYKARLDRLAPRSRRLGHYRLSWLDPLTVHDIEACTGAFLLIRADVLQAVGGWDEAYRFYAEDLDLCARVTAAGWRVRYVGTETATHVKGASSHLHASRSGLTPAETESRRWARAAAIASHERYFERHMEATTAAPLRPLVRAMFALQRRLAARGR